VDCGDFLALLPRSCENRRAEITNVSAAFGALALTVQNQAKAPIYSQHRQRISVEFFASDAFHSLTRLKTLFSWFFFN